MRMFLGRLLAAPRHGQGERPGVRSVRASFFALAALFVVVLSACGSNATTHTAVLADATPTSNATPTQVTPSKHVTYPSVSTTGVPRPIQIEVNNELTSMTLDQKLGQMIQVETYYQSYTPDVDTMVRVLGAGSMIIYGKNMKTPQQLQAYIASVQANANMPLFISMDEEGGNVDRLGYQKFNAPLPSAQWLAATGNPQLAYQDGLNAARELTSYGINLDLAPVVDVAQVPSTLEGERLFGDSSQTVDTYAKAFLKGLQAGGVIGCLKHWPGIGSLDSKEDPHLTLPTINSSLAQLNATDFAAFKGILPQLGQDRGMVMVTHVIEPAIDPSLPASLSPKVVGVLRNQLGYDGVIMTDNLYMQGISKHYTFGQAAVMAVEAGDDIVANAWNSQSMEWVISSLKTAIANHQITVARINQSVRRILTLKAMHGIFLKHESQVGGNRSRSGGPTLNFIAPVAMELPRQQGA